MLLEVWFGWGNEIRCVRWKESVVVDPKSPLSTLEKDWPTSEQVEDLYVLTRWPRHIGYLANLAHDTPAPTYEQLDVLCIGWSDTELSTLKKRLSALRPKYCIPLGERATTRTQQRSQEVMATGHTFPKLLRPGQVVVVQHT